jgi:putative ABC transport system substrate-binding protein
VAGASEIAPAVRSFADQRLDVVIVGTGGGGFASDRPRTVQLVGQLGLPAIYNQPAYVEAGGLISYGGSRRATSTRLAAFADLIFRGSKPSDIAVEQVSTFNMAINLKTAKSLGLTIPPSVLFRADLVIE